MQSSPNLRPREAGWFQGWLTVFQLQAMLLVVASIVMLAAAGPALLEPGAFAILIMASVPAIGLVLLMRRSRYARAFWISFLSLIAVPLFIALQDTSGADAVWGIALLAANLAWIGYWIRSTRVRASFPPLLSARPEQHEPRPWFQGWPTVFQGYAILLVVGALTWFFANADDLGGPGGLILLLFALLPLYAVRLIAIRSPSARLFCIGVLALSLVVFVLSLPDGTTPPEDIRLAMVVGDAVMIAVTLLWLGYWIRRRSR